MVRSSAVPWRGALLFLAAVLLALGAADRAAARVLLADPGDYLEKLKRLAPGDTLALAPGNYRDGLPLHGLEGTAEARIHVAGPDHGAPAVIHGRRGSNVVSIVDSAYVTVRDLRIDGGGRNADGVKAEGHARFAHHITLAGLVIENLRGHQQIVGISTKCPAWGWVVQGNEIRDAGTGMYFGKPDGSAPFVDGVIENNLVVDPIGYGIEIKHQGTRPGLPGMPREPSRTVIRHNVIAKGDNSSTGDAARPNLLVGHFPERGPGMSDRYAIYGNLLYNNPSERLFQGEGNIDLYNNLLINPAGSAVAVMPHKGHPRRVSIFHNTIVARDTGIWLRASDQTERVVVAGNAVFAAKPLGGAARTAGENRTGALADAKRYLRAPLAPLGELDAAPVDGALAGDYELPVDLLWHLPGSDRDFDGRPRTQPVHGAYAGRAGTPAWQPALAIKRIAARGGGASE